jgi:MoaA/NifB/PqqE/SkfB family radical SAM enzyme
LWRQFETPEGLLLYDRSTGLNILLDSFKKQDHNFFDRPLYAQVKVTNRCNLRCGFCSQRSDSSFKEQWAFDELFSLFKYLDQYDLQGIALGGGEPFTFPRLSELVRKTWNETGLDISITSNGLLIGDDDLKTLAGNVGEIRISCWTAQDLRKAKRLLGKGVHIGINTILFASGIETVKEVINSSLAIGIDDFLVLQCRPYGRAGPELSPSNEDFRELANFVNALGINVKVDTDTALKVKGLIPYTGPWSSTKTDGAVICVTEDKCVAPNSFDTERKVPIRKLDDIRAAYEMWYYKR